MVINKYFNQSYIMASHWKIFSKIISVSNLTYVRKVLKLLAARRKKEYNISIKTNEH